MELNGVILGKMFLLMVNSAFIGWLIAKISHKRECKKCSKKCRNCLFGRDTDDDLK